MTTVAIDSHGIIAADGRGCIGDELHWDDAKKIVVRTAVPGQPRRVFSFCGPPAATDAVIAWYEAGHNPKDMPPPCGEGGWTLIIIESEGDGYVCYYVPSTAPYRVRFKLPYAFGSGGSYALGALKAGATAHAAVQVACEVDVYSGGAIQVVNIAESLGLAPVREAAE